MTPIDAGSVCEEALLIVGAWIPPVPHDQQTLGVLLREARERSKVAGATTYRFAFGLLYDALTWTVLPLDASAIGALRECLQLIGSPTFDRAQYQRLRPILSSGGLETTHRGLADAVRALAGEGSD